MYGQSITLKGAVYYKKDPVKGAAVWVTGTTHGSITEANGEFELESVIPAEDKRITIGLNTSDQFSDMKNAVIRIDEVDDIANKKLILTYKSRKKWKAKWVKQ